MCFNRRSVDIWPLAYWLFFTAAIAGASLKADCVDAAPLTLAFTAVVGPPRQGVEATVPPNWGFTLAPGDMVSGKFTFEPVDVPSSTDHTTLSALQNFSLQIKTRELSSSQYFLESIDDEVAYDAPVPRDRIRAGCYFAGGPITCNPATDSIGSSTEWAAELVMYGGSSVLDGADIPAENSTWQAFDYYELNLSLFDRANSRDYGFEAFPNLVQLIPEPHSFVLLSWIIATITSQSRSHALVCDATIACACTASATARSLS